MINIETAFPWRKGPGNGKRRDLGVLFNDRPRQLRVGGVSRFDRNDMTTYASADEREVTDDVENFVPREFICKTQRFLAQDSVAANHDRVFQTSPFDQILLHQGGDFLVEDKGACRRNFAFVKCRRNFAREKLGKAIVRSCLRTGDTKLLIGQEHEEGTAL